MIFPGSLGLTVFLEMDRHGHDSLEDSDDAWQVAKKDVPSSLLPEVAAGRMPQISPSASYYMDL